MTDTCLVTGASGLVGSALVRAFIERGDNVVAVVRDPIRERAALGALADAVTVVPWQAGQPLDYDGPADLVVHAGGPTASRFFADHPIETIQAIADGAEAVLEWAAKGPVRALAYLSSLEVYGVPACRGPLREADLGYLDPLDARSSYPEAKRLAESLCSAYARERGVPARIVRLAAVVGPLTGGPDDRFTAQVIRAGIQGQPVRLLTDGGSERSHIGLADAVAAILAVLEHGQDGQAYNVANEAAFCSMRHFAETAARLAQAPPPAIGPAGAAMPQYLSRRSVNLDSSRLRGLGWVPRQGLEDMLRAALDQSRGGAL